MLRKKSGQQTIEVDAGGASVGVVRPSNHN